MKHISFFIINFLFCLMLFSCDISAVTSSDSGSSDSSPSEPSYSDPLSSLKGILIESFEDGLNTSYWTLNDCAELSSDDAIKIWQDNCHKGVINDPHKKVIRFDMMSGTGTATLSNITMPSNGAISFDYKSQCFVDHTLTVTIDGTTHNIDGIGIGDRWRRTTLPLTAGDHTIVFSANNNTNLYYTSLTNAIYIDNVTIADNTIDSIEITPRGTQQTYIGGHTIQYSANALRSDKSVISGKTASWSVSGGGNITSDGLFTPNEAGTFSVTATIDGKTGTSTIVVHQSNTSDSITIAGMTFTGVNNSTISGSALGNTSATTFDTSKMPNKTTFSADGYFPIVGTVTPTADWNALLVSVTKGDYNTQYILQGSFDQRIWLRFGHGEYTVEIADAQCDFYTDINGSEGAMSTWASMTKRTLTVTNTSTMAADEAIFLLPSHYVNSDNYLIQNVVADIMAQLPANATLSDKLRAIHDWETDLLYYDSSSTGEHRRKQESVNVLLNKCAVCEGYSNLYAALARNIGASVIFISSQIMNHGWTKTYFDGDWRLTDLTFDDPATEPQDETNTDPLPYREDYSYFIIDGNTDHEEGTDAAPDYGRGSPIPPRMLGEILTGWF